jgi:hypothetical protein
VRWRTAARATTTAAAAPSSNASGRAAVRREGVALGDEFAEPAERVHDTAVRTAIHDVLDICPQEARRRDPVRAVLYWQANRCSLSYSKGTA